MLEGTPKQIAAETLVDAILSRLEFLGEYFDGYGDLDHATKREENLVYNQINKIARRMVRAAGQNPDDYHLTAGPE